MNSTHKNISAPEQTLSGSFKNNFLNEKSLGPRSYALATKVIDLTHDTLPENKWKPIKKAWDKLPPQGVMDDKIFLREWEHDLQNEYYRQIFDRREMDVDVFKKFAVQGEIIQMQIDAKELTKDDKFW